MTRRPNGFTQIIVATVFAGLVGYLVTWWIYRHVGPADYSVFAVFWSALFLVVGGLSGIQQEVTRATRTVEPGAGQRPNRARNFGAVAAAVILVVIVASSPLWADAVFPTAGFALVLPLAVGAASYVLVTVLAGSLFGLSRWPAIAAMLCVDAGLRIILVLGVSIWTSDIIALSWAVAAPFPLSLLLIWPIVRRGLVGRSQVDVGYRALSWNATRAVLASVSTAILVSGFPLLIGVTAQGAPAALVGELIFTITLARAPVIVTVMSLQSYFVVRFRDAPDVAWALFLRVLGLIVSIAAILAVAGWLLGPLVFSFVAGAPSSISGELIAILVASSALVGALCLSGAAVLARSAHVVYSAGWAAAALSTILIMAVPLDLTPRVMIAILVGPVVGLLVHITWLVANRYAARREEFRHE